MRGRKYGGKRIKLHTNTTKENNFIVDEHNITLQFDGEKHY